MIETCNLVTLKSAATSTLVIEGDAFKPRISQLARQDLTDNLFNDGSEAFAATRIGHLEHLPAGWPPHGVWPGFDLRGSRRPSTVPHQHTTKVSGSAQSD